MQGIFPGQEKIVVSSNQNKYQSLNMKRPLNQFRRVRNCGSEVPHFSSQIQMMRQVSRKAAFWSWMLILLFLGQSSFAQESSSSVTADVTGTVLTEKGELLQGATVVARNTATNITSYSVTCLLYTSPSPRDR